MIIGEKTPILSLYLLCRLIVKFIAVQSPKQTMSHDFLSVFMKNCHDPNDFYDDRAWSYYLVLGIEASFTIEFIQVSGE